MNWHLAFSICNSWIVPFWLILAFAPRTEFWGKIVLYAGVGLLSLVYAIVLPLMMAGVLDSGGDVEGSFSTLKGVMNLLSTEGGAFVGWIHYLAFDMFVGLWVARNADERGIARWIQIPILFFTLMAGPLGLTLYLLLRGLLTKTAINGSLPH